ncbi:MAG: hypothetical protein H7A34_04575 [bacterium]|nr:hypothetical protein [bacterium]
MSLTMPGNIVTVTSYGDDGVTVESITRSSTGRLPDYTATRIIDNDGDTVQVRRQQAFVCVDDVDWHVS